ncbi:MAG TPA: 2-succinyl-5-enolpyruvyl-6-hydroxy-3-cyclohexene-1-carboxylic-acid synthase [Balneolaceae bacterium]|nr:2-succinyl-5-enolpyruvyl-6-hydroxy-3-cyclohexene-1-carboxylic-acid synthase [Balneolaceae bacterium]
MTDLDAGNATFYWSSTFFLSLQKMGVQHVVISPGSRSTPLTLAAASHDHFQKHVILDERSAAFTALGIGKATNIPAVLVCTSGTALANYYPAVIEARKSGIPLILATADRPPLLRDTGANQATDQLKIFGDYPVLFHEVGEPGTTYKDLERLQMLARQAVSAASTLRGPVHLNFPFRKPLEPDNNFLEKILRENKDLKVSETPCVTTSSVTFSGEISKAISEASKPLIIVGPTAPSDDVDSISNLAKELCCPILAESTIGSQNTVAGFAGFLRNKAMFDELEPDLILRFGFQPTSKSLELGLKNWNPAHHFHFASTESWQDATYSESEHISWMGKPFKIKAISPSTQKAWLQKWEKAEQDFRSYTQKTISESSALTDGSVYHQITPQISNEKFIMVSNSFPARDILLFGRQQTSIPLFLNRGVSGIDGVTSSAFGISIGIQKPGVLFSGDLAFLHDTNALLNHRLVGHPLTIMLINNNGGSIFRMLPVEQHQRYFNHYFETPQSANIKQLVNSYEIPYCSIDSISKLKDFDLSNWQQKHAGVSVIECRTDADASMQLRKDLWNF